MKWLAIYLLLCCYCSFSQSCKKNYFEVIDTGKCEIVAMSAYNYATLYRDSKTLEIVSDSLPKLIKGIEKERIKGAEIDSLRLAQIATHEILIEDCEKERASLEIANHEITKDRDHHKHKEKLWKRTSFSQLIVIIVLIVL